MSDVEESSKAVAEVAKFATSTVEKVSNATGFIAKYIDEPLNELVGKWVDNKKFDRWENKVKIQDRVNSILKERGCETIRMIPPKLGIPLIDNALLEDDDDLRELWCKLIANSLDSTREFRLKYVYIDIIKSLTPLDALILKYIHEESLNIAINMVNVTNNLVRIADSRVTFDKITKEIKAEPREIRLSLNNLMRVQCINEASLRASVEATKKGLDGVQFDESYSLTELGISFIDSCMKD